MCNQTVTGETININQTYALDIDLKGCKSNSSWSYCLTSSCFISKRFLCPSSKEPIDAVLKVYFGWIACFNDIFTFCWLI